MDRIFSAEQIVVPENLPGVLKAWTKDVIRANPSDLQEFSAIWFSLRSPAEQKKIKNLEKQYQYEKERYDQYELNQKGKMHVKDISQYIRTDLGYQMSDEDMKKLIRLLDGKNTGLVEFKDIMLWWRHHK